MFCFTPGNCVCPSCFYRYFNDHKALEPYQNSSCKNFSFYHYHAKASYLLKKIKYRNYFWMLTEFLQNISWSNWLTWLNWLDKPSSYKLIPVPLSTKTYRVRGFNQSEIIAQYIKQLFSFPIINCLTKKKENQKQAMLKNFKKRQNNVKGVYLVTKPLLVKNQNLIVVDDVITTGSTINEIIKVLKSAGAKEVRGFSLFKGG